MDVIVHSFTATPDRVETGGGATVSWNLTVPDTGEDFELKLNGQTIGAFGHRSFSNLIQTTDFALSVVTADGDRVLLKRTVIVDPPECRWATPLDAFLITQPLKFQFDTRFSGSSQFRLRGNGTVVTLGDAAINIAVPITVNVEDWFDADMDVAIELSVTGGGGSRVIVLSRGVSLDVN